MPTGRTKPARRLGVLIAATAVAFATLAGSGQAEPPPPPPPTIAQVTAQVESLYHEMELAAETYNDTRVAADEARAQLETLESNLARQQEELDAALDDAGALAADQYRGGAMDPALALLLASSGDEFLERTSQLDRLAHHQDHVINDLDTEQAALEAQQLAVDRETTRLDVLTAELAEHKKTADTKLADAETLLARLTAEEQRRLAEERAREVAAQEAAAAAALAAQPTAEPQVPAADQSDTQPAPDVPPASGRAQVAINFALAQVGDAYVWGAAGPNAWDCSGLTMMAWAAAGVSLPHSSKAQFTMGTRVSTDQMQPGDLVFYYSPISHVGMYIGNGQLVHAANPSKPVNITSVSSMPITGVVRVG